MKKLSTWLLGNPPEGREALGASLAFAVVVVAVALMIITASGCSSEQLARDEAVLNQGLSKIERGINWAEANPAIVGAALDEAAKLGAGNPHVEQAIAKGRAALANGDAASVLGYLHAAVILTTPTAASPPK